MKWSTGVVRVVDEATLNSCAHVLLRVAHRANASPDYAHKLGEALIRWMNEIWPPDQPYSRSRYLIVVGMDLDRIPDDLLEALSQRLFRSKEEHGDPGGISGRAAGLIACWLRTRLLELRGHVTVRTDARLLKREFQEFFGRLMANPETPVLNKLAS